MCVCACIACPVRAHPLTRVLVTLPGSVQAAYNYVLRPVAPSPPSGVPSTAPAAPASPMACSVQSGNQGGGELLGPSIGSGYSSSSTQPSTQPASYKYPSISPQASHCAPSGDVYALDLQRQMEQLAIRSNTQQQVQPAQQAAVVPSPTLGRVYTKQDIDHATDHFSPLRRIGEFVSILPMRWVTPSRLTRTCSAQHSAAAAWQRDHPPQSIWRLPSGSKHVWAPS